MKNRTKLLKIMEQTKKKCKIREFGFSPKNGTIDFQDGTPTFVKIVLCPLCSIISQEAFNFLRWEYEDVSLWIYGNQRKAGFTNLVKVIWN